LNTQHTIRDALLQVRLCTKESERYTGEIHGAGEDMLQIRD